MLVLRQAALGELVRAELEVRLEGKRLALLELARELLALLRACGCDAKGKRAREWRAQAMARSDGAWTRVPSGWARLATETSGNPLGCGRGRRESADVGVGHNAHLISFSADKPCSSTKSLSVSETIFSTVNPTMFFFPSIITMVLVGTSLVSTPFPPFLFGNPGMSGASSFRFSTTSSYTRFVSSPLTVTATRTLPSADGSPGDTDTPGASACARTGRRGCVRPALRPAAGRRRVHVRQAAIAPSRNGAVPICPGRGRTTNGGAAIRRHPGGGGSGPRPL